MAGTKKDAQAFVERWRGRGSEEQDSRTYWIDLFQTVLGVDDALERLRFEQPVKTAAGGGHAGFIDVLIPSASALVEQKSAGTDLDKPEERQGRMVTPAQQGYAYAEGLPLSQQPRYVVACNFQTIRVHDRELDPLGTGAPALELALEELPENLSALQFLKGAGEGRLVKQREVSEEAGRIMGRIHADVAALYHDPDSPESHHALAVFCTRIMFLMYAEDSGIIEQGLFQEYVAANDAPHLRGALLELFRWLDTPPKEREHEYPDPLLARFPYMDGGLFREPIELPQLSEDARYEILISGCQEFDWSSVDPTVFGSIFEGALSHDERRAGGMHYTSPENIHRVIDPLFLDGLTEELDHILEEPSPSVRTRKLKAYHQKLGSLTFLDPACGSGNFLTETYTCVRRLENRVLVALSETGRNAGQGSIDYGGEGTGESQVLVRLDHFRGIEINDYACCVARTALLIAERQADQATERAGVARVNDPLPLEDYQGIVCGNALSMDWDDVLPASECSYVLGNPPFVGARNQSKEQKAEVKEVFGGIRGWGDLDYVACWYQKAAEYTRGTHARCAFVSTNSICQGQQVSPLWRPLAEDGIGIDFAHDTFRWDSLADDEAHVHVVVVGFSREGGERTLYHHERLSEEAEVSHPAHINFYLKAAPDVFITNRGRPLCNAPKMGIGSQPIDDGNYLFTDEEKKAFLKKEPAAEPYFHRWLGSQEFIHGEHRWVLWLGGLTPSELNALPRCKERVQAVREYRLKSKRPQTLKAADRPNHFGTEIIAEGTSVLVPEVSSERRRYVPMGFIEPETFCSNLVRLVPNATLYHFGVLTSRAHNAWMRTVAGRLKSDYRYSNTVVYNNFVWPGCETKADLATPVEKLVPGTLREKIEGLAQEVLAARESYAPATLADLYDPDDAWLYPRLTAAHEALDAAVEEAYGLAPGTSEDELTAHLFELYARLAG